MPGVCNYSVHVPGLIISTVMTSEASTAGTTVCALARLEWYLGVDLPA